MLQKYKEIIYGILFGAGAVVIDALVDAHMDAERFGSELLGHHAMLLYRLLFIAYGLIFGWVLWQRNRRERDFRYLAEAFKRVRQQSGKIALLMHSRLQVLLTRDDFQLPHEAEDLVRFAYDRSRELQTIVNDALPPNALGNAAGERVTSSEAQASDGVSG